MPFGKLVLLAYLMIPMLLHQVSSLSADSFIIAITIFFIAKTLKIAFAKEDISKKEEIIYYISAFLMGVAKSVYIPVGLLSLLIIRNKNIIAIVLFGSYARKMENNNSDIDIAIKLDREFSKKERFELQLQLEELVNKDIDLLNLDDLDDGVRYEVLINGETLYAKDELKFELYKLEMYREYLELNESRAKIIENLKNGDGIYGKPISNNK